MQTSSVMHKVFGLPFIIQVMTRNSFVIVSEQKFNNDFT